MARQGISGMGEEEMMQEVILIILGLILVLAVVLAVVVNLYDRRQRGLWAGHTIRIETLDGEEYIGVVVSSTATTLTVHTWERMA